MGEEKSIDFINKFYILNMRFTKFGGGSLNIKGFLLTLFLTSVLTGLTGCATTTPALQQSVPQDVPQWSADNLPHRTTGLDPQGHLEAGFHPHENLCLHQNEYYLMDFYWDYSQDPPELMFVKTHLFCWGKTGQ